MRSPNKENPSLSTVCSAEHQDVPSQGDLTNKSESEPPQTKNGVNLTAITNKAEQMHPLPFNPLQPQKTSVPSQDTQIKASPSTMHTESINSPSLTVQTPKTHLSLAAISLSPLRGRSANSGDQRNQVLSKAIPGAIEVKLGKNRTKADMRLYMEERDLLEREREKMRSSLAKLKKERRE
ncbi:hypothetical protein UPYG_G00143720, partial [Umbra pygmaea]